MKKIIIAMLMTVMMVSMSMSVFAFNPDAKLRAIHASPDAPAVDIWVNGGQAFTEIDFRESTGFAMLPAKETYNIKVVPSGATEPVVIEADLALNPFRTYTVVALDNLNDIMPIVIEDKPLNVGRKVAAIRFIHASPDAPAVDVALKDGPVLFSDVAFKEYSDFLKVPGNTYDLEVRLAGTDTVVLDIPGVMLDGEYAYTAVAVGEVGAGTLDAQLFNDGLARLKYR